MGPMTTTTKINHPSGLHVVTTTQNPGESDAAYLDRHTAAVIAAIQALG